MSSRVSIDIHSTRIIIRNIPDVMMINLGLGDSAVGSRSTLAKSSCNVAARQVADTVDRGVSIFAMKRLAAIGPAATGRSRLVAVVVLVCEVLVLAKVTVPDVVAILTVLLDGMVLLAVLQVSAVAIVGRDCVSLGGRSSSSVVALLGDG
jgi:hypothetical protein